MNRRLRQKCNKLTPLLVLTEKDLFEPTLVDKIPEIISDPDLNEPGYARGPSALQKSDSQMNYSQAQFLLNSISGYTEEWAEEMRIELNTRFPHPSR